MTRYLLSIGPAVLMFNVLNLPLWLEHAAESFYSPLIWIDQHVPVVTWHIGLWT